MSIRISQAAILFAAFVLTACGEQEVAVDEDTTIVDEQAATEAVSEATEATTETTDDEIEVVEESAAEPEDTGEEAIVLAQADTASSAVNYRFEENRHYFRLMPAQPTVGGADKIEVAEFFWYGCLHCLNFEPIINNWDASKPANVRFVRIPAMWNSTLVTHAQLFYTEEVLVRNGVIEDGAAFHEAVFEEIQLRNNRLMTEEAIQRFFARFGVPEADFNRTWSSFEVAQKLRVASDLARRYNIASVPTMVVNGKYRTGATEELSTAQVIDVVDELVARESAR